MSNGAPVFAGSFPFPKIFMQDVEIVTFPGNAPTGEVLSLNLQPAAASGSPRTTALPMEYYGPTMYHGYTDDLGSLIPPKGPWHGYRLLKNGMYYKITLVKEFANHYLVVCDEVRNG